MGIKPNFDVVPHGFIGLLSEDDGVTVKSVFTGSAADKAGLKPGDVIVSVKDTDVSDGKELAKALAKEGVGAKVALTVKRGTKMETLKLELGRGL
jgi:serine protease Do